QGKHAAAVTEHREAVRLRPDDPGVHNNLGAALYAQGKHAKAVAEFLEALRLCPAYPEAHQKLCVALYHQGQYAATVVQCREALKLLRKRDGPESVTVATVLAVLGKSLLKQQKYAEADPILRECLAIRMKKMPDDWKTFNARSMLGGALLGQKKY